jgi:microcystin degradation protein MlrC
MGSGGLVVTDHDAVLARRIALDVARLYWTRRHELEPRVYRPDEAVALGRQLAGGPVLLVETADCCGGGAAGDSVASLKALLAAGEETTAIVPVVDPAAASLCHTAGLRGQVTVHLGHQVDPHWGTPVCVTGVVNHLCDGRFQYVGGIFDGQVGDMGPTAVLRVGAIDILVTSRGTYDWNGEQLQRVGLDPRSVKFLVVKNPMNFNMAFRPFAAGVFILDTPGPTPASVRNVAFQRLRGPWYPRDPELLWSAPQVTESAFAG